MLTDINIFIFLHHNDGNQTMPWIHVINFNGFECLHGNIKINQNIILIIFIKLYQKTKIKNSYFK